MSVVTMLSALPELPVATELEQMVGGAMSDSVGSVEIRSAHPVVEEIPVIEMVEPMPGFADRTRFALVRLDDDGVLCALRSVEDPDLRFLVVPPHLFFEDYAPEIDDNTVAKLGIDSADDVLLLSVVNPGSAPAEATANLLAPVLINTVTRQGCQVVLTDDLPVRAPLLV